MMWLRTLIGIVHTQRHRTSFSVRVQCGMVTMQRSEIASDATLDHLFYLKRQHWHREYPSVG